MIEFPAMLHGSRGTIRRGVRDRGQRWAREYLKAGAFTLPRQMLQVPPDEVLVVHSGADFDVIPRPRWRIYMFANVFMSLIEGVPETERPRMEEAFESFCLSNSWGALYHAVSLPPKWSAANMARRLAALLRFWDVLEGPRYAFWSFERECSLAELMENIYCMTLNAWCPESFNSVREHLSLMVERMMRATREECMEAVLRVIPELVSLDAEIQRHEQLGDPNFLRERLSALSPEDFESLSSADRYAVNGQLYGWNRALGRP